MRLHTGSWLFLLVLLLSACNTTKFVPDGEFLLDKVSLKTDNSSLDKIELREYLRQTPNAAVFSVWRMQLGIYNLASKDSSKWLSRTLRKIGDPPVIYSPAQTAMSTHQLQLFLQNKGYINATVESDVKLKGKKASVGYNIKTNEPYRLRNYTIDLKNEQLNAIAQDTAKSLIRPGMLFNTDILNAERDRIASTFRKQGFYNFNKDFLVYSADSALNSHKVDVTIELRNYLKSALDSANKVIFKQYYIRKVIYHIDNESQLSTLPGNQLKMDTVHFRGFDMITPAEHWLEIDALIQNTYINPNTLYSDASLERTYQSLNSLGPVKYVNISFDEKDPGMLDCQVNIVPAKTISLSTEAEGTYTAGYWGVAGNINYTDRNLFKGAEVLSLQLHGAFEKQDSTFWAREFGVQAGLKFPKCLLPFGGYNFKRSLHANTEFTSSFTFQERPGEFTTTNASAGINYSWTRRQYRHVFQLFDLSYVSFPYVSSAFKDLYLSGNPPKYNPYNYSDHLILRMGYLGSYSTFNSNRPMKDYSSVRYSIETAGNLLYGLSNLVNAKRYDDGYKILNVPYSEYVKGEYNITHHQIFNKDNRFVYHLGLGLGIPFGNSTVIPYEKRFYSGGANSVRGWGESMLGPGVYKRLSGSSRDFNQVGDIKLDMNMEYRTKLFWIAEGAFFLDAGNIWTIDKYKTQLGGDFQFDSFMNQIAIAYGVGLRLDFSFFIARIDLGIKLFDPVESRQEQWRILPSIKNDFAWHFAIGYPF